MEKTIKLLSFGLWTLFLLAAPAPAAKQVRASWNQLGPLVEGKILQVHLRDGAKVRALADSVDRDGLRVAVRKTSEAARYPKGSGALLPRDRIERLRIASHRFVWRGVLTTFGATWTFLLGGLGGTAGFATGGVFTAGLYYLGRAADRRWVDVVIVD